MKNIISGIERYLTVPSNYAILLSGAWGIGKSHFIIHHLKSHIRQVPTLDDNSKQYYLVYISLFGVNSIEELHKKVFLELYPLVRSGAMRGIKAVGRSFYSAVFNGNIDDILKDLGYEELDWGKYGDVLFCFDDIERRGDGLSIKSLSGFINHLADTHHRKVILVANEDKIEPKTTNENNTTFSELKEKIIGLQIEFEQAFEDTFENILQEYVSADIQLYSFLKQSQSWIKDYHEKNKNNLRTLVYFILIFKDIFYPLYKFGEDHKHTEPDLYQALENDMERFAHFCFSICIEFKKREISYKKRNRLDGPVILFDFNRKDITVENTEESYAFRFQQTYFPNSNFHFYESAWEHITGGPKFDANKHIDSIKKYYNIDSAKHPYDLLLEKLSKQALSLDEKEYLASARKLFSYAKKGVYHASSYLNVFTILTWFDNILQFDLDKLTNDLSQGIRKSLEREYKTLSDLRHGPISYRDYLNINKNSPYSNYFEKLKRSIEDISEELFYKEENASFGDVIQKLHTDPKQLIALLRYGDDSNASIWKYQPFFHMVPFEEFFNRFKRFSRQQLNDFETLIEIRYYHLRGLDKIKEEATFFKQLSDNIDELIHTTNKKKFILIKIYTEIQVTIHKYFHNYWSETKTE